MLPQRSFVMCIAVNKNVSKHFIMSKNTSPPANDHKAALETAISSTATEAGIVVKKGAWFQYEGELVGQGRDASANALAGNPELARKIKDAVFTLKVRHTVPAETAETPAMPEQELAEGKE